MLRSDGVDERPACMPRRRLNTVTLAGLLCLVLHVVPCGAGAAIPQTDSPVLHLATYRDSLIADCMPALYDWDSRSLKQWTGTEWREIGVFERSSGYTYVDDIRVYGDMLLVAGNFATVNGDSIPVLAAWNGTAWSSFADSISGGSVKAMTLFEGDLVIGGDFSMVGGVPAKNIARWDGEEWSPVGGGRNNAVSKLAVFDGKIVVAISRTIQTLDNGTWTVIGEIDGTTDGGCYVATETLYADEKLLVGGSFMHVNGIRVNHLAGWSGDHWGRPSGLGCGLCYEGGYDCEYGVVYDLLRYEGALVACGIFNPHSIARWDGAGWQALDCGTNGFVYSMVEWEGSLLAGGVFGSIFCHPYSNIGVWDFDVVPLPSFGARTVFNRIRLAWTNPSSADIDKVIIRFSTEDFPETAMDGEPVPNGSAGIFDAGPGETAYFDHRGLSVGTTYYYSAFVRTAEPERTSGSMKCKATASGKPTGTAFKLDEDASAHGGRTGEDGSETDSVRVIGPGNPAALSVVPNPMSFTSAVCFNLDRAGHVRATVYDSRGRAVRCVLDGALGTGNHRLAWDGRSETGQTVPVGLYFFVLESPERHSAAKVMVIR